MYKLIILSWLAIVVIEGLIQFYLIEKKNVTPNYGIVNTIRFMISILHGVFLDAQNGWHYLDILFWQCSTHWLIFGPLLNTLRGKSFWYLGAESGTIDPFLLKHPILQRAIYFACIPIAVLSYLALN
jgi:hypothetical protein